MKLSWRRQTLRTRHRFATSQGGVQEKQTIVVRIEDGGVAGEGEIVPSALYGQSLESAEAALADARPLLDGDPREIEPIVARLLARFDNQRATVDGLDAALHDWNGHKLGLPAYRLLGLARPRVRTTFTLGVAEPNEMRIKLREALAEGFDAIKVKVGTAHDERNLALIREQFNGSLFLDANQAWRQDEALARIEAVLSFRPEMIEQPLPREDWRALAELRAAKLVPIFVDEDCERPADIVRLAGCVDGVNIKLNKCGGIREALRMIALARAHELRVMLGCFVSSSLAIAPALTIATLADYADLDGALLLAADPYEGIERRGSELSVPDEPGFGLCRKTILP